MYFPFLGLLGKIHFSICVGGSSINVGATKQEKYQSFFIKDILPAFFLAYLLSGSYCARLKPHLQQARVPALKEPTEQSKQDVRL